MRAAVLGAPIAHSLSPALHRAAYAECGIDATYEAIELHRGELRAFLDACGPEWLGLSLTMPLKEEALEVVTNVDPRALQIGAANTIVIESDVNSATTRTAYNTDVDGVKFALADTAMDELTVLGAGASARSAIAAGVELGARSITVLARRSEAAEACAQFAASLGVSSVAATLQPDAVLSGVQLCVSTLPPHAADHIAAENVGTLLDIAYDPWPSALANSWLRAGGIVISGHEMLLGQAVRQVELMTGRTPQVASMRAAMEAAIAQRR